MTAKPPSTAPGVSSPQAGPNPASAAGAAQANALVHVENLTKRYRTTTALRDFSLDLPAGHIVGLMGPSRRPSRLQRRRRH